MSPLALLLARRGWKVAGSDRSYDQGRNSSLFEQLKAEGVKLYSQDGSAVSKTIRNFVVTRAVESTVPDLVAAQKLGLKIVKRPVLMAELFAGSRNIAVGGTSGKSTTTAMIGHILHQSGLRPTIVNGAVMLDFGTATVIGDENLTVFEADESDGFNDVIAKCSTAVAVLTNISLDHFEIDELVNIFGQFLNSAGEAGVINADCESSDKLSLSARHLIRYGIKAPADITPETCSLDLKVLGRHNVYNALAAVAACSSIGIPIEQACSILKAFSGVKRRLELIGVKKKIAVYDDFASNPGKIAASLGTLIERYKGVSVVFQPHGFQPTKMMRQGYIDVFSTMLRASDSLIMPEIYYAGGSSNVIGGKAVPLPKDISSLDLINEIQQRGIRACYLADRAAILPALTQFIDSTDCIVVMGSRDETLPELARSILENI